MKNTAPTAAARRLFLIEFYTVNLRTGETGWDINFAWVFAPDAEKATTKLANRQGRRFDTEITVSEAAEIRPLAGEFRVNTKDANLFIIQ